MQILLSCEMQKEASDEKIVERKQYLQN
jgi:hypothetical protein